MSQPLDQHETGIADVIRASPYLTRLPESFDPSPYPDTRRVRTDARRASPQTSSVVFVSYGTVVSSLPAAEAVYQGTLAALGDLSEKAVLTTGGAGTRLTLGAVPENVTVADWVDQDAMIAGASVVVCHGGAGTTFGALENGVPVVVVPFVADQPTNARIVTEAGAGLTVEPDDSGSLRERLREAIETVLREPSFRQQARIFADETAAMPTIGSLKL